MLRKASGLAAIALTSIALWATPTRVDAQGMYAGVIPQFSYGPALSLPAGAPIEQTYWLGGDGAFEAPLGPSHSVWFFSDSFISKDGTANRMSNGHINYDIVHNTMAIAAHGTSTFTPTFYCRGNAQSGHSPFIPDWQNSASGLWPRGVVTYGQYIIVFAVRMSNQSSVLIRIDTKGTVDVTQWEMSPLLLGPSQPGSVTGSGLMVTGNSFFASDSSGSYLFSYAYSNSAPVFGIRIPVNTVLYAPAFTDITQPYTAQNPYAPTQCLASNFSWQNGIAPAGGFWNANIPTDWGFSSRLRSDGVWQTVFTRQVDLNVFISTYTPATNTTPAPAPPASIQQPFVMTANTPYGNAGNGLSGWSNLSFLPKFPMMDVANTYASPPGQYNRDLVCYGVTEQPDFESSDSQIFYTYNTHSAMQMHDYTADSNINYNPGYEFYRVYPYATTSNPTIGGSSAMAMSGFSRALAPRGPAQPLADGPRAAAIRPRSQPRLQVAKPRPDLVAAPVAPAGDGIPYSPIRPIAKSKLLAAGLGF